MATLHTDSSLTDALHGKAALHADKLALAFLERGDTVTEQSTYRELYRAASVIAGNLVAAGLAGRPVVLSLPPSLDFVRAFLACLDAGVIAVPAPFPAERRSAARCSTIIGAARPAAILTSRQGLIEGNPGRSLAAAASGCPLIDVAELKVGGAFEGASPHRETIALVQYTSGSVSNPKGVVINHGNLLANLSMIREAFQGDETKALVSWLPPHHDMGLIGCVLAPLFSGMTAALMSPFAFLQRPLRWLQAMQKFGATTAGAPNFAYDLCARQISDTEARKLDLSAWRLAFCGSEPLRPGTFRRFAERFAAAGFDPRAFLACYGMAEATLLVTSARVGAGISAVALDPNSEQKVISCGTPCRGTYVLIEPSAAVGGPPETGEICVSGEHVTAGFWDGASAAMRTDPERELVIDGRRYLRTGDAGLIRDGELYVVGRLSDMIIVNGANIHAEDIEATVLEMSEEEDLSAVAAFGVQAEQREELIVACELKRRATPADPLAILEMLGRAVADAHGVLPTEVLLLDYGALERTGTGKIRRGATRAQYLAGSLNGISWRAPGPRSLEALG